MEKIEKNSLKINRFLMLSLIVVIAALFYTVYILNSQKSLAPIKTSATSDTCTAGFIAVKPTCAWQYYTFEFSRDPQIYANQLPNERTATEINGKTVPVGTYDVDITVEDNNRNQMQDREQVYAKTAATRTNATPDLPDDPNADPSVWLSKTYPVGKFIVETSTNQLTVRHQYAGQNIGPHSISPRKVMLSICL